MQARLITQTGTYVYLRRYRSTYAADGQKKEESPCSGPYAWHDAMVLVEETDRIYNPMTRNGYDWTNNEPDYSDHTVLQDVARFAGDPRWPTHCAACGYAFEPDDSRQVHTKRRYDTPSGRTETGCLFWAGWFSPPHLMAILPSGEEWDIDGPSSNGPGWTRTGEPPNITASPSILTSRYHGFLQGGVFTPDLDKGRTYETKAVDAGY